MAKQQISPKADQPRATTSEVSRESNTPTLQYRTQGVQSFNRSPSQRSYGRTIRG